MSGSMRRYLSITEEMEGDFAYDEFGVAAPIGYAPPRGERVMTKVVPSNGESGEYTEESRQMVLRLLVKIQRHVQTLVPSVVERTEPVEPWVQDKLSQAAEALESVADYLLTPGEVNGPPKAF